MSDTTLEDDAAMPRWILDEPTVHDAAPEGTLDDCDGVSLDGSYELVDRDGTPDASLDVPVDGMDGVDLPDADEAEADFGDPPDDEFDRVDDEAAAEAKAEDEEAD